MVVGRPIVPTSPHLSFVGLLRHLSFIGDVHIPFKKDLLDLIGFNLEMDGEYLPSARFDGYRGFHKSLKGCNQSRRYCTRPTGQRLVFNPPLISADRES